jgi:homopolymeric O-antigen transport system ATP-binding protein
MLERVAFEGVWKSYPRWDASSRTLKAVLLRRVPGFMTPSARRWALRDVSLQLRPASITGLIGPNGAGKSTLLRLASGVGAADRGRITLPSDTASVLSLGYAFSPDLTGKENAYTAALLAGLAPHAARAALSPALSFAELEEFADAPLRTYSDGMKLRLAFGVVAQLAPQALLLDEVLAVGDLRFQRKCIDHIEGLKDAGATILMASHGIEQVAELCDDAVWLEAGHVRAFGPADVVVGEYREAMRAATLERTPAEGDGQGDLELGRNRFGSQELVIEGVRVLGSEHGQLDVGGRLDVRFELRPTGGRIRAPIVGVSIHRVGDGVVCYDGSTEADGVVLSDVDGPLSVELCFPALDLLPGQYVLDLGVYEAGWAFAYDYHWHVYGLTVVGGVPDRGVFRPRHAWTIGR